MMKKRKIKNLEVSEIGMGCMGFSHGYGEIPTEEYSIEAIRQGYDFGCTFFDTAEVYAPPGGETGHNESILGKARKEVRNKVAIATKIHLSTEEAKEKGVYKAMKEHLTASLKRLQTDHVDLYYVHRINKDISIADYATSMEKLIDEGLIKGWGMSQVGIDTIKEAQAITPLSAIQNIYSMIERTSEEEVIPYCLKNDIAFVPFSPTSSGLLSGKVNGNTVFSNVDDVRKYVPQLSKDNINANLAIVDLLKEYADKKNATPAQISLAWMLYKYPNVIPIPGSKNKGRILENLGACNVVFTSDEFVNLDTALNHIPIKGIRGHIEFEGDSIKDWGRKK